MGQQTLSIRSQRLDTMFLYFFNKNKKGLLYQLQLLCPKQIW